LRPGLSASRRRRHRTPHWWRRRRRDPASRFHAWWRRHQQPLRAFLRRTCGDWSTADDLAQETFLTAWDRIGRLERGASVRAWLCGIGYHKHLSAIRSRGRERAREAAYEAEKPPSTQAMTDERLTLEAAMADLPPDQRACVALCLAADFSHQEAADCARPAAGAR
jgi:RNA polymerase sigma-70 factor (ECF subfamily)